MPLADSVLDILHDITDDDRVRSNLDLALFDTGVLDSLATVELMARLADELGFEISPADVERAAWATPRLLIADLTRRAQVGSVA